MKKKTFIALSDIVLPLDKIKLEPDELIAIKGGYGSGSGFNCDCNCTDPNTQAGSGDNCHCNCT
ncbi:MAG: hypothetical protein HQ521_10170 [Bacteroidetes bacterium]|nr:hypothetical protein [Bacteroidota bacterium]